MSIAVLLCADRAGGFEAGRLGSAVVVDDLCRARDLGSWIGDGVEGLVLGVCAGEYTLGALQTAARKANLDPLGVEVIDLPEGVDAARIEVMVAGGVAGAGAFAPGGQAKMLMPRQVSRRALLRFNFPEYTAAPAVVGDLCVAADGCRACVIECPQQAISWSAGAIHLDRVVCEPCGRCITVCPTAAVEAPGATPARLEAVVKALLDRSVGDGGGRGIVYRCRRSSSEAMSPGWFAVTVPCAGMVTPGWMLAPLLLGASGVAVPPCSDQGCPLAHDDLIEARISFCRNLLSAIGADATLVAAAVGDWGVALEPVPIRDPFGPLGGLEIVNAISAGSDLRLEHRQSPAGVIRIDPETCTGCTMCARVCPTGAIGHDEKDGRVRLDFDAAACVACGQCLPRCPERARGAIRLERAVDATQLARGRTRVFDGGVLTCRRCGGPIATSAMMERITTALAGEHAGAMEVVTRYCVRCRGLG